MKVCEFCGKKFFRKSKWNKRVFCKKCYKEIVLSDSFNLCSSCYSEYCNDCIKQK